MEKHVFEEQLLKRLDALIGRLDGLIEAGDELVATQLLQVQTTTDGTMSGLAWEVRAAVAAMNKARAASKAEAEQ